MPLRRRGGALQPVDWLVVGLGNPGARYAATPHNVGFGVADALIARWDLGRPRTAFGSLYADGRAAGAARVGVLLPQTYMNESGRAAGPARGALHVALERVVVVHDELDLAFGDVRTRLGGGLAGHNGLRSLKQGLGGQDFWRVRCGIGRPDSTDPETVSAHVLGRWRQSDAEVGELIERAADAVERLIVGDDG